MTSRTLILAGLATIALTALALYARPEAPRPTQAPPVSAGVRCEGRVAAYPGADVVVSAEYGGRLADFPVQELDTVRSRQMLARLDAHEQQASLAAARARIRELDAELRFLDLEQRRLQQLVSEGTVSQRSFDDADSRLRLTQARREAAQASAAQLQAALSKLTLAAPFAGTIIERFAQPGEILPAGGKLVRLANLDRLRVEAEVDEYDLGGLKVGSPVTVEVEGRPGMLRASVEEVPAAMSSRRLKALDPSRPSDIRVSLVKVALPAGTALKLGQRVELSISTH